MNRGWVPEDFRHLKQHYQSNVTGYITGVLYSGDAKTKYSKSNQPMVQIYSHVYPEELSLINQMNNREEAGQFMLAQIDTDEQKRQILPSCPDTNAFTKWKVMPERNLAYANLWQNLTMMGVFANTCMWLVF